MTAQLTPELQLGLLQRYRSLRECVHHSCLNDRRGLKAIAADCDLSVSELSRRLHPAEGDPRSLDVDLLVQIMQSTGDLAPLHWLLARFLPDDETRRRAAVDTLTQMMPRLAELLAAAGGDQRHGGKRTR